MSPWWWLLLVPVAVVTFPIVLFVWFAGRVGSLGELEWEDDGE